MKDIVADDITKLHRSERMEHMKIPKKIEKVIEKRRKLAEELNSMNMILDDWIEAHGGNLNDPDICDSVVTGCMIYCEPDNAAFTVTKYILEKM